MKEGQCTREKKKSSFKALPHTGYIRLPQIIGDPKSDPPTPALIPISRSTFLAGVRDGRFPRPIQLSRRCVAWKVEEITALIERLASQEVKEGEINPC